MYFFSYADYPDEPLHPDRTLSDYQLTEVSLLPVGQVSQQSRSVTATDILRMQRDHAEMLAREAVKAKANLRHTKQDNNAGVAAATNKSVRFYLKFDTLYA